MTMYEQYKDLLENFSSQHEDDIKSVLVKYDSVKDEKGNAFDYIPPIEKSKDDPRNKPIFLKFINIFMDTFINPYKKEIKVDLNHHYPEIDGKTLYELDQIKDLWNYAFLSSKYILSNISFKITLDLINQTIFKGPMNVVGFLTIRQYYPNILDFDDTTSCSYCSKHAKAIYDFEKKIFRLPDFLIEQDNTPCVSYNKSKKEQFTYDFSLNIPSKKLVFMNDIRQVFKTEREDKYTVSINSELGKKRECEEYVKNNMAYFYVGNTSPTIYQHKTKNEIIIDPDNVKLKWNSEEDTIKKINEYDERGYICTDLWAVCMADHDDFMTRCKEKDIDPDDLDIVVVDISKEKIKVKYNFENCLIQIKY